MQAVRSTEVRVRRELIKAFVAFFMLGVILGGMYLGVNHLAKERGDSEDAALRDYWQEKLAPDREEKAAPDPDVIEAPPEPPRPGRIPRLAVQGRFVGEKLVALEEARATAAADGGAAVPLVPDGGWLKAEGFENAETVTLAAPGRALTAGPVAVGESEGRVRFTWAALPAGAERLAFADAACVEAGRELRVFFQGRAQFPDGASLVVCLERGDQRWCNEAVTVDGKRFEGVLAPEERGFPSGAYTLAAEFNPLSQDPDVMEPTTNAPVVFARAQVYIGAPESEADERAAERGEYLAVYARARAIKSAFTYLRDAGLAAKGPSWAVERNLARIRPLFGSETSDVARDGQLDVAAWRVWIDERVHAAVEDLRQGLGARQVPAMPEVHVLLDGYLRTVQKAVHVGSLRVHEAAGLACAVEDMVGISLSPEDEEAELTVRMRAMERQLSLALRTATPEPAKDAPAAGPFR